MINNNYKLLLDKQIITILDGDVKRQDFIDTLNLMPYLSGPDLCRISTKFGLIEVYEPNSKDNPPKSRWQYLYNLINHCIKNNTINKLLQFLFSKVQFKDLNKNYSVINMEEEYWDRVHQTIEEINKILYIKDYYMYMQDNNFYINSMIEEKNMEIEAVHIDTIDIQYVKKKIIECEEDIKAEKYDSVITKCRTVLEEVFIYILEKNNVIVNCKGDITKLYKEVTQILGLTTSNKKEQYNNRINSALITLVQTIGETRNNLSDSYGVGSERQQLDQATVNLMINATKTLSEFILAMFIENKAK